MLSALLFSFFLSAGSPTDAVAARPANRFTVSANHATERLDLDKVDPALHTLLLEERPHPLRGHAAEGQALAHVLIETRDAQGLAADYTAALATPLGEHLVALSADAPTLRRLAADVRVLSIAQF